MLRNGAGGLALVLLILFVFLEWRLAFWVAAGIPIALLAAMVAMKATGQSINMVSLFALIMTLGIIVDDAIVVGEHTATLGARGMGPVEAARAGAFRMLAPVTAASLTTIAAFLPILMISDVIGQIIVAIPLVVIAVIVAALAEAFLILPAHMRDGLRGGGGQAAALPPLVRWRFRTPARRAVQSLRRSLRALALSDGERRRRPACDQSFAAWRRAPAFQFLPLARGRNRVRQRRLRPPAPRARVPRR